LTQHRQFKTDEMRRIITAVGLFAGGTSAYLAISRPPDWASVPLQAILLLLPVVCISLPRSGIFAAIVAIVFASCLHLLLFDRYVRPIDSMLAAEMFFGLSTESALFLMLVLRLVPIRHGRDQ